MPKQKRPVERTPEQIEAEKAFQRAGHPPEDPHCDHRGYDPQVHGRYCPDCDTCMWDASD